MKWSKIGAERRQAILEGAAARLALMDEEAAVPAAERTVGVADIADFARARSRLSLAAMQSALRTPALLEIFDRLLDRYAVSIPMAAAAATDEDVHRRRSAEQDVNIEWVASSVDVDTIFVRVYAPAPMRPVHYLVLRSERELQVIALLDTGGEIEVMIERDSPQHQLLQDMDSKLWLN